jgi:ATP-dependent DNA helicase RecQ
MPLFDVLKAWRKSRAEEEGVPAFVVFGDRTLAALASSRPTNMDELFTVFGVGAAKRDRFGKDVLEVIADFGSASADA